MRLLNTVCSLVQLLQEGLAREVFVFGCVKVLPFHLGSSSRLLLLTASVAGRAAGARPRSCVAS